MKQELPDPCLFCGALPIDWATNPNFRLMDEWDERDETVLLLVDYSGDGEHALDDALVAITIGHNNDHNVGEGEGQGWQFAGWCWTHDHYVQGIGKPIGWLPLPHWFARAREAEVVDAHNAQLAATGGFVADDGGSHEAR